MDKYIKLGGQLVKAPWYMQDEYQQQVAAPPPPTIPLEPVTIMRYSQGNGNPKFDRPRTDEDKGSVTIMTPGGIPLSRLYET